MTDPLMHPSEDDLVLLFYGEWPDETQVGLRAHLEHCAGCRSTYHAIARTLHVTSTFQTPDPGPEFEARMWQGIAPRLRVARRRPWWVIAALAAVITLAVGAAWTRWQQEPAPPAPALATAGHSRGVDPRENVLMAAVDAHLMQTEVLFVELMNAPADATAALDYMQSAADDLLASGRLYRETARATGAGHVVAVLDELEPVLVQVARTGEAVTARDLRALRGRIEEDDLLFKVRAVSAGLHERQEEHRTPSEEGAL